MSAALAIVHRHSAAGAARLARLGVRCHRGMANTQLQPARAQGDLAFRPVSYTPWPVEEDYEGERVRVRVGSVAARQPRTFAFSK